MHFRSSWRWWWGLGFIALVILFHSILVPLTGALTSLLSLAAAMGITVAIFQWGGSRICSAYAGTGPIFPFVPIMVFAILFGLSMDYQVFLVSRMQEEWMRTNDNKVEHPSRLGWIRSRRGYCRADHVERVPGLRSQPGFDHQTIRGGSWPRRC